jgi:hypothetical protein
MRCIKGDCEFNVVNYLDLAVMLAVSSRTAVSKVIDDQGVIPGRGFYFIIYVVLYIRKYCDHETILKILMDLHIFSLSLRKSCFWYAICVCECVHVPEWFDSIHIHCLRISHTLVPG